MERYGFVLYGGRSKGEKENERKTSRMKDYREKVKIPTYQLKKNILSTLWYFDAIERSLTAMEVWRFCLDTQYLSGEGAHRMQPGSVSYRDVLHVLNDLVEEELLYFCEGWYGIFSRKDQHEIRKKRKKYSVEKLWRLRFWISFLRYVPFVRSVIVTGGLSSSNATKESDWDVLIVVRRGHIWTARFLMAFVTHCLGKRRYGRYVRDRVCLNHFISDGSLSLQLRDLFSAKEYVLSLSLCNDGLFRRFLSRNTWMRSFFPLWEFSRSTNVMCLKKNTSGRLVQRILEAMPLWDVLENKLRSLQKKKILNNPASKKIGSYIVADDDALIFLPNPHGPQVFEKFKENAFRFGRGYGKSEEVVDEENFS